MENLVKLNLPKKNFWNNKKIFITGHTSFKGSWLKLWLEYLGAKVYGYSIDYPSNPKNLNKILFKEKFISQSILDFKKLKKKIEKEKPDIVFHLAAQSIVSEAAKNPLDNYKTNIIGTASVLEASANCKNTKLVAIITTDKCYKENKKVKYYKEQSELGGSEPYSASKACAELISESYYLKYEKLKKKIITLRAGNVIGGGDWKKNRIIPDILKSIIQNKTLYLRHPNSVRPWLHVLDCLNGYLIAAEYSFKGIITFNTWNFAPNLTNQITVYELVKIFLVRFKKKNKIKILKKNKFYESNKLNLGSKKAGLELKWKTVLNQKKTIDFIFEWYSNYLNNSNMKNFSVQQIKKFYKIAKMKNL